MSNLSLKLSKKKKNDEFYTQYSDIQDELSYYPGQFPGKVVYCNCDDETSNFRRFFLTNFHSLGLKKLYCTSINGHYLEYDGCHMNEGTIDGDFRSPDCINILKQSDICVTNPPFSLFREFFTLLILQRKDFLIIGNKNALGYKEVFPFIKNGLCNLGYTHPNTFVTPDGSTIKLTGLCRWFTSFETQRKCSTQPTARFSDQYLCFDWYPAINVDRVADIPCNYSGLMGVPITFLDTINRDSFCIVDLIARNAVCNPCYNKPGHQLTEIKGQPKYSRLIIKSL